MERLTASSTAPASRAPGRSAWRGATWFFGALAWLGAAAVGAVLAVVFAVSLVVIAVMASMLLALSAAAVKARRFVHPTADPNLIEARHLGGHSWVAYGWDGQG